MLKFSFPKWFFAGFTFLICLLVYYFNLAPGVTLEDSGEFLIALKFYGTPHPPGYPLYSVLGSVWVNLNPSSIAFMGNLFSALCMSLSCLVYFFILLLLTKKSDNSQPSTYEYFGAIFTSVLVALTPHVFRQSLITEVYGLHQLLCLTAFYFLLNWILRKSHTFLYCFFLFSGLAFSNHHIYLSFFIPSVLLILFNQTKISLKDFLFSLGLFCVGLLPYLYLPIQAKNHFYFNWGDPQTAENFLLTVMRFQYFPHLQRTLAELIEQIREYFILLFYNFNILIVVLSFIGLSLSRLSKRLKFYLWLLLLSTGPVTSLMINFKIPTEESLSYIEVSNTMSVFFLTSYFAMGIGAFLFLQEMKSSLVQKRIYKYSAIFLLTVFLIYTADSTIHQETKKGDLVAQELFQNLELVVTDKPSLVITNWDPFSFPSLYYKLVENKFPHTVFIDLELLKGTWYQKSLKVWYPQITDWFENKDLQLEDKIIQARSTNKPEDIQAFHLQYQQLIRNIISNALKNNYQVIAMIEPRMLSIPQEVNNAFKKSALPIGYQFYHDDKSRIQFTQLDQLKFSSAIENKDKTDRLIKMIYNFYFFNLLNMTKQASLVSNKEALSYIEMLVKTFHDDPAKIQQLNEFKKELHL